MSKSVVHSAQDSNGKRIWIVDTRDAEQGVDVFIVTKHGDILEKGVQQEERHKFRVKTVGSDSKRVDSMVRNEAGKFKPFEKPKVTKKRERKQVTVKVTAQKPKIVKPKKAKLASKPSPPTPKPTPPLPPPILGRNLTDADIDALAAALLKK